MNPYRWIPILGVALSLGSCTVPPEHTPPPLASLPHLVLERPIPIPSGRARALFQEGHQVLSPSYFDPYCELVTAGVSTGTLSIAADRFGVTRIDHRLLKDPISEIPPFILGDWSCQDPLYQESKWFLKSEHQPGVLYLRCLVPYFHCQLGPATSEGVVQTILGPDFRLD